MIVRAFTAPRKRQEHPADRDELQRVVRECAEYLQACGMDDCAEQLLCRAFGDDPEYDRDPFGREFLPPEPRSAEPPSCEAFVAVARAGFPEARLWCEEHGGGR